MLNESEIIVAFKNAKYKISFEHKHSSFTHEFENENRKLVKDQLFIESIQGTKSLVSILLDGENGSLVANTQTDKTRVQILSAEIASIVIASRQNKLCIPMFLQPASNNNFVNQFHHKCATLLRYYGHMQVSVGNKTDSIKDYNETVRNCLKDCINDLRLDHSQYWINNIMSRCCPIFVPTKRYIDDFSKILDYILNRGYHIILLRDEIHHSSAHDSQLNSTLDSVVGDKDDLTDKEIKETVYNHINGSSSVQFVKISATQFADLKLKLAILPTGKGYFGLNSYYTDPETGCKEFITGNKPQTPQLKRICDIVQTKIKPQWYTNSKQYYVHNPGGNHEKYCKEVEDAVVYLIKHLFESSMFSGIFFRFANNNKETRRLIEKIKPRLPLVKLLAEFDAPKNCVVETWLDEATNKGDCRYVVFATSGCRMSDTLPRHCGIGIFCENSSHDVSMFQGNRICGYGYKDVPIWVLSNDGYKAVMNYLQTGETGKPKVGRKYRDSIGKEDRERWARCDLKRNKFLNRMTIMKIGKDGKKTFSAGRNVKCDIFDYFGKNCVSWAYLESECIRSGGIAPLAPGEYKLVEDTKRTYAKIAEGYHLVSIRNISNGSGGFARERDQEGNYSIVIQWRGTTDNPQLVYLLLPASENVTEFSSGSVASKIREKNEY